ncbi:MAG: hypothetical protein DWB56_14725 [Candidatus Jettenia sp.]|uniref:Uncharacterized protein n=1 Tax=Candidatus Jettenia caeni TaxID=247490 RepID=I3ILU3_9BACT|nr:hypothetical protein [Candidatus Jettenia sp. AMX1]KAA0243602.1 MAG: hypothetical protein EDM70_10120 [Candidatus Brocadia sp. AMX2]MBC6930186.1 hypothetical protein [Candidatus Jettenia sp.]RIJ88504.1 MAG: hypothetical protein DCC43_16090 [Candidatus Brocadia sp.]GAB62688.1 hypothetical protein KSU1_C1092 [Candidatus Jettenia caeni]MCQ3927060.1 hypothetical protein [Candidatus Jettenia sp.]
MGFGLSETEAIIKQNNRPALRGCLMCGEQFHSPGPHIRRCAPCEEKIINAEKCGYSTYRMPVQYAVPNQAWRHVQCDEE